MIGQNGIIGRKREQKLIAEYVASGKAELVAVYGRRRVGKTFLIRQFFNNEFDFYFTGSLNTSRAIQLRLFHDELQDKSTGKVPKLNDWFDAFAQLKAYLSSLSKSTITVFLDELPWMDTPRSNFLQAFSYFWNSWGCAVPCLKFFVCGSATTWMTGKLIGDKGGLHGRVTRQMYLRPFGLEETEQFLASKNFKWNRYQIAETYMAIGGIPYYLDMLEPSESVDENIDALFFADGAPLHTEYGLIFRSLFNDAAIYRAIVELLASKGVGMTRDEIMRAVGQSSSGTISTALENLCRCDFLRVYKAFGKKSKEQMYQLVDLFSLFHLRFVEPSSGQDAHYWSNMSDVPTRRAWEGYAFEQLCLHHIPQIKQKLRIGGVLSEVCSWQCRAFTDADGTKHTGTQIDMLIDRRDDVINICEMKFSKNEYAITGGYAEVLRRRFETFRAVTGTRKALQPVLVTTYGLAANKYSGIMHSVIVLDDLFQELI